MLNRTSIYKQHPWLRPGRQPLGVILGDDLDAALSGALFLHLHPGARIVGVYSNYTTVHYDAACAWEQALDAVWLDLDIYHPRCRSLGHHIVRLNGRDRLPGFAHSLNLNDLWGKSLERHFDEKYPLGTVHFLMWLYGQEIPELPGADLLVWLADSAYINAQERAWRKDTRAGRRAWVERPGFRRNVRSWLEGAIRVRSLQRTFQEVDTRAFEERMQAFQERMETYALERGTGQVASHHLKLFGYQCQPTAETGAFVYHVLEFVAQHTGWTFRADQVQALRHLQARSGTRVSASLEPVRAGGLASWLQKHDAFSYVFTHFHMINYTTGLGAGHSFDPAAPGV
jgi:hypothetical protein